MSGIFKRSNDALNANPNDFMYPMSSDINITTHGSDWYWAVTAVMAVSTIAFMGLSFTVPRRNPSITMVAAIAYFTMASNLGYAAIPVEFQRSNPKVAGFYREIFYVRYIDWVVTTPLLLLDILLTAGLPWPTILYTLLVDEIMVITGLVGALVASSYKWGYFVFAMVALFFIAFNVCWVGLQQARVLGQNIGKTYMICAVWTIALWFIYPIAWGLCEGGNIISPDSEAVFYGILDILAKPVFGALLIMGHRTIDPRSLGFNFREYDEPIPLKDFNGTRDNGVHNNGVAADNVAASNGTHAPTAAV
ncbi:opsin like protein [Hyphodiscus hymeniophilus]|uniref:Opsin like protein n=1 Tax=Hyphodiscus hymeniophilus TaxID=353542 RepID=A0A9P6VL36_9HELO|nr:opsin like protein [Hyphodiscus hymeniophilus]